MVSTIIAIAIVYQILIYVLHIIVVVTKELQPLQLNDEIVATAMTDVTDSLLFYADLMKFLNYSHD
jgi:hypothetical protein